MHIWTPPQQKQSSLWGSCDPEPWRWRLWSSGPQLWRDDRRWADPLPPSTPLALLRFLPFTVFSFGQDKGERSHCPCFKPSSTYFRLLDLSAPVNSTTSSPAKYRVVLTMRRNTFHRSSGGDQWFPRMCYKPPDRCRLYSGKRVLQKGDFLHNHRTAPTSGPLLRLLLYMLHKTVQ